MALYLYLLCDLRIAKKGSAHESRVLGIYAVFSIDALLLAKCDLRQR